MNRKHPLMLLLVATFTLSFAPAIYERVTSVYDGDTILLNSGRRVRYLGIDAPEIGHKGETNEFMALASKAFNVSLVAEKRVKLEFDQEERDDYDRLLAYVYLENGDMINALMVKQGLAWVMAKRPNLKHFSFLLNAQRSAMEEGLSIWSREELESDNHYIGSRESYRFHRSACAFAQQIRPHNLVVFEKRRDAFWEGFSPCKRCRP